MLNKKKRKGEDKRKKLDLKFIRKKACRFCKSKTEDISYRNVELLANFVRERGTIIPGRISGNCARHQRMVTNAIKRAREAAFLPFTG
jgi:small subunit ribosomal protein S18